MDCPDGVGMEDLVYLAGRWMANSVMTRGTADVNGDGRVDLQDFGILAENWMRLDVNLAITCGALFEYLSGDLPRGPRWMTQNYMEWLARLLISPRRYAWRYLRDFPVFTYRIAKQKIAIYRLGA